MIDFDKEDPIRFGEAARLVPGGVHRATIGRWAKCGVRGVFLEYEVIGGKLVTSKEAVERFLAACREKHFVGIANGPWIEEVLTAKERFDQLARQIDPTE